MHDNAPRLLAVAHGTASVAGSATTARLVSAVSAARPQIPVDLCFLDVVAPRLPDALDERPTIVVPLLLSTGYHVQTDIPRAVASYPYARVARHLGPHPLLIDALVDRLAETTPAGPTTLVGAGSTRAEAAAELATTATLLGERLEQPISVLTMGQQLRPLFAAAAPVRVATYLLAEGQFVTNLERAIDGLGSVAAPLGAHPALVELVWRRYDEVALAGGWSYETG
jgi:sirohydrochlorin ferrochelatase